MTEISSAPISSVGDSDAGRQDRPPRRLRSRPAKDEPVPMNVAPIETVEEDTHRLDEQA